MVLKLTMTAKREKAMTIEAMKAMANYIDVLGGDSKKYRQAIAEAEKPADFMWKTICKSCLGIKI